jgi:hypothetical protein
MALAKKPLEIFQQVTAKSAEELAGVSAMFVVVRAKWNASHHIRRPFRQNDALRFLSWHLRLLHLEADVPRGCGASPQATSAASRPAPPAMTKGQGNRRRRRHRPELDVLKSNSLEASVWLVRSPYQPYQSRRARRRPWNCDAYQHQPVTCVIPAARLCELHHPQSFRTTGVSDGQDIVRNLFRGVHRGFRRRKS